MRLGIKVILPLAISGIISGCGLTRTPIINLPKIPNNLSDDATHAPLKGNYFSEPTSLNGCRIELRHRADDVINLLTSIHNNNVEMKAIRRLNR